MSSGPSKHEAKPAAPVAPMHTPEGPQPAPLPGHLPGEAIELSGGMELWPGVSCLGIPALGPR